MQSYPGTNTDTMISVKPEDDNNLILEGGFVTKVADKTDRIYVVRDTRGVNLSFM